MVPSSSAAFSPPMNHTSPSGGGTTRNVLSKLVLDGYVKEGADGAIIRLYAKMSVPEFPPAQTYSLFPESSTRLLSSAIHPLSQTQTPTPYAFPPNASELVLRARHALALPHPLPESYPDILSSIPNASHRKVNGGQDLTPAMTGEVIVSNFEYCFLSPRILAPPSALHAPADGTLRQRNRRNSIGASLRDGPLAYYILAMELSVPLVSLPPNGPFMINLQLPRCLQNSLKLRLFAPGSSRARSAASTSSAVSDDERWDVRTIPPLLAPSHLKATRSNASAGGWSDDEAASASSASGSGSGGDANGSTGGSSQRSSGSGAEIIRGTFPSAERLIIRWSRASAGRGVELRRNGDMRKRVSVERVESAMRCSVGQTVDDGKNPPSVPIDIIFQARCIGVCHPGVETALGLDIILDSFGVDAIWDPDPNIEDGKPDFDIQGGDGVRGWSWASERTPLVARATSQVRMAATMSPAPSQLPRPTYLTSRSLSSLASGRSRDGEIPDSDRMHSASLLRAPLPGTQAATVPDYSFESPSLSMRHTASTEGDDDMLSLPSEYFPTTPSSRSRRSSIASANGQSVPPEARSPLDPFTLHIDILPLLPTSPTSTPTELTFTLRTRLLLSASTADPQHIPLPTIRLPSAESHLCAITLCSQVKGETVTISAPEEGKRSVVVAPNGGVRWDVDIAKQSWTEGASSASGDVWGDDCLLLVVPPPIVALPSPVHSPAPKPPIRAAEPESDEGQDTLILTEEPVTPLRRGPATTRPFLRTLEQRRSRFPLATPPTNDEVLIPWVEMTVTPVPPRDKELNWSHLVHLRAPWPSSPSSQDKGTPLYAEFAFPKIEGEEVVELNVIDASIDGRRATWDLYPGVLHQNWAGVKSEEDKETEWSNWVRIAPSDDDDAAGIFQVFYECKTVGKIPKKRKETVMNVALPTFCVAVSRVNVSVDEISGYDTQTEGSNFDISTRLPYKFMHHTLAPYRQSSLALAVSPRRRKAQSRSFWRLVQNALLFFLLYLVFTLAIDIQQLRAQLDDLANRPPLADKHEEPPYIEPPTGTLPFEEPNPEPEQEPEQVPSDLGTESSSSAEYFPSIPFDDSAFEEYTSTVYIPVTTVTVFSTHTATPTPSQSERTPPNRLGEILVRPFRHPFEYFSPTELVRRIWGILVMLFHYPLPPE